VTGILADANIQGQVDLLVMVMQGEPWRLFWDSLKVKHVRFADVGLPFDAPDSQIWEACQQHELVLITDNRNDDGPDSLEAIIRTRSTPRSLPVLTIANVPHLGRSRAYADRVIEKLLDFLEHIEELRGAGRLYLP
jgi:hypothetical protein